MAINFGLFQSQTGTEYLDTLRALGQQQALQQDIASQQQRNQIQGYQFNQQRQQDAARPQILQRAQSGDYAGAQQQAFAIGDYDAAKMVQSLDDRARGQLGEQMGTLGRLATSLIRLPQEQRGQAFAAVKPLLAQKGFNPQLLEAADLSDGGLQQYIAAAAGTDDAIKNYYKSTQPMEVSSGATLINPQTGEVVYQAPTKPDWQFDSESGSWLQKPGTGTPGYSAGGGGQASGSSATAGRYQYGWTPRARNGGDNSDAAVDGKIAGMSRALGLNPDQPFPPGMSATQIAQALALSEGGRGSLADRNNNPGNLRDPRSGAYRQFGSKDAGIAAAAAQVQRNLGRGQNTVRSMVEGVPVGGGRQAAGGQPGVINVRPPKAGEGYRLLTAAEKQAQGLDVNTQYQVSGKGQITALGGQEKGGGRKGEADLRKEFEQRQDVKDFRKARTQFNALRETALNPNATAQDDIAVIFQFMKTLDPTSTVREGEFATAQNATGVPDAVRNAFNKAQNGERLNPQQRKQMAQTAYRSYQQFRDAYNNVAGEYRGYASDYGVNPDRVARTYTPDKPARSQQRGGAIGVGQSTTVGNFTVRRIK